MIYMNSLEAELNRLERELRVAELNGWEFDIQILKEEIIDLENELNKEYEEEQNTFSC